MNLTLRFIVISKYMYLKVLLGFQQTGISPPEPMILFVHNMSNLDFVKDSDLGKTTQAATDVWALGKTPIEIEILENMLRDYPFTDQKKQNC